MRLLGIFGLAVAMMLQVFSTSIILLNYGINQSSIIANFCVNKEEPELKCNGKCHLKKQLKADTENKSETPATLSELVSFVLTVEEIAAFNFDFFMPETIAFNSPYLAGNYSNTLQSIFHPPQI
ncbi:hypothetical protein ACFLR1_00790 [Bacteroidota bacterium]